ncbi:MAG TPA: extracellular solute-binding protein [Gemmatimonadales bacterium]|nr:extracellular solute-binding protein [Gemmatimonadales bacterium]
MRSRPPLHPSACAWCACLLAGCVAACRSGAPAETPAVVTFPGSALGAEAAVLHRQLARFMAENPDIRVEHRPTPDADDQRHQLYVRWLNAGVSDPDILQLDVIWTPEFAAAGWILPLDRFGPDTAAFFPATLAANRWRDTLFALPWFADVGMLYWRTDLVGAAPADFESLRTEAMGAVRSGRTRDGLIWQGARYASGSPRAGPASR